MQKLHIKFLLQVAPIYLLSAFFLVAYVLYFNQPVTAAAAHLYILSLAATCILSVQALCICLGLNRKKLRHLVTLLLSSFFYILLCYYALVIISLLTWNKVITKEFIVTYASQLNQFLEVLDISIPLSFGVLLLCYLVILFCYFHYQKEHPWFIKIANSKPHLIQLLIFSIFLFASYQIYQYCINTNQESKEPFYLTLNMGTFRNQSHIANQGFNSNPLLNQLEENIKLNYQPNLQAKKKNIIFLLSDALRPDHMSLYGYKRNTTPKLNKIVAQQNGLVFSQARSTCGETACAHASLFGSRYAHQLPNELFTLQDVLKKHGYYNRFIISGDHVNFNNIKSVYGNSVDYYFDGSMQSKYYFNDDHIAIEQTQNLPKWDGKPTFIHYHLLSNHVVGNRFDAFNIYSPALNYAGLRIGKTNPAYINHYDNGVHQADWVIETLLNTLKEKGYLEDSIVVVLSDHGESLGEHNMLVHTNSVYEQALRIPLVIIPYGKKLTLDTNTQKFLSIIDIAPTLLKALDMPIPSIWQGTALQNHTSTDDYTSANVSYFQMMPFQGFYLITDKNNKWKYWQNKFNLQEYVFNVSQDPAESKNMIWSIDREFRSKLRLIYKQNYTEKSQ